MRRRDGVIVRAAERALFGGLKKLARSLGPRGLVTASRLLADFARTVLPRRRRLVDGNLAMVFPEKSAEERQEIATASWRHFARAALEFPLLGDQSIEEALTISDIDDLTEVRAALAEGRGLLLLTAHFGSWERAAVLLTVLGAESLIVARAFENEHLAENAGRARKVRTVDRRKAAKPIHQTLAKGGVVVLLIDQATISKGGVMAPFLGRPAATISAPARLMLKHDVPAVMVFCVPAGERLRVEMSPVLRASGFPPETRTVEGITTRLNEMMSERIRRDPHLWFWMHDRWKERRPRSL